MLDSKDTGTFHSLQLLCDSVREGDKPLLFWIGAGASAWCGYPLWEELAQRMHSNYLKYIVGYDKENSIKLTKEGKLPEFFGACRRTDEQIYFKILSEIFSPRKPSAVYQRFINTINAIEPHYILTTNIDELLENNLPSITTVQRSDFEGPTRCIAHMPQMWRKLQNCLDDR